MSTPNDVYCDVFFNEIYTNPNGQYRFCCHAKPVPDEHLMNSKTHTPFEWFKSDYMEQVRNDAFDGVKNPACTRCYDMEDAGSGSFRTLRYNQHNFTDISDVKLNLAISNVCNLSCYMCGPENSTTKQVELNKVFGKNSAEATRWNGGMPGFALKKDNYKKLKESILDNIDDVKYINLIGGEPMMIPEVWDLLDAIPAENAKKIKLCWITNMTKVGYKNYSLEDVIAKYEDVTFNISCDHFGLKESWIRYPIDIKTFEENLVKYHKYITHIQVTVSILNGSDLIEIRDYYNSKFDLRVDFTNMVAGVNLAIDSYPNDHKEMLINKYENDTDFDVVVETLKSSMNIIHTDFGDRYSKDLDYCQKLSEHRNFHFRDIWKNQLPGL